MGFSPREMIESLCDAFAKGRRRHVVAIGRYRGTFRSTSQRLDAQFVHVWTVEGGRVTRFQQYADTAQFLQVTGTSHSGPAITA